MPRLALIEGQTPKIHRNKTGINNQDLKDSKLFLVDSGCLDMQF